MNDVRLSRIRIAAAALLVTSPTLAAAQNGAASTRATKLPARIAQVLQDDKSLTLISVLDENLDLAARLARESGGIPASVPLAPPLVVGQGADASN